MGKKVLRIIAVVFIVLAIIYAPRKSADFVGDVWDFTVMALDSFLVFAQNVFAEV